MINSKSVLPKCNLLWVTHGVQIGILKNGDIVQSQSIPPHPWNTPSQKMRHIQNKVVKELTTSLSNCPIITHLTLTQNPG